jgi:hypothetical protein
VFEHLEELDQEVGFGFEDFVSLQLREKGLVAPAFIGDVSGHESGI